MVMTDERFYTVDEVAERMRVTVFTVRNWLRAGQLGGFRAGGRKAGWRIRQSDLDRFIAQQSTELAENR
jgi:excisionase family DNA binding protein